MPKQCTSMLAARLTHRRGPRHVRCRVLDGPSAERGEAASRGADATGTRSPQMAIGKRNVVWLADRVKLIWWDGTGLCLLSKRLEGGQFRWPRIEDGVMRLTPAQLSALVEGLDWARVAAREVERPRAAQ